MALKAKSKKYSKAKIHHMVHNKVAKPDNEPEVLDTAAVQGVNETVASTTETSKSEETVSEKMESQAVSEAVVATGPSQQEGANNHPEVSMENSQVIQPVEPVVINQPVIEAPVTEVASDAESGDQIAGTVTEDANPTKWVAVIIVLGLLLVAAAGGGFYYLTQYKYAPQPQKILSPQPDSTVNESPTATDSGKSTSQSSSDEIQAISKDVDNTDLGGLDQEMVAIDKELP